MASISDLQKLQQRELELLNLIDEKINNLLARKKPGQLVEEEPEADEEESDEDAENFEEENVQQNSRNVYVENYLKKHGVLINGEIDKVKFQKLKAQISSSGEHYE